MVESWPARLVGERTTGSVASAAQTVANGGPEPLIFVPRAAHTGKADPPRHCADRTRSSGGGAGCAELHRRHALFTRQGRKGVRQVNVTGLVAAAFTHRDSRAGDPDLHTHVAVANKLQTLDRRWLSIDGRVLSKATVAPVRDVAVGVLELDGDP